jgi:phage gpG-like protein
LSESIEITITGDEALQRNVMAYARRLSRPFKRTNAAGRVDAYVANEARRQITHGQRGDYTPLSPRYARYKAARYPGRPMLVVRGDTVRSMTDTKDSDHIRKIGFGGKTLTVGSKSKIAGYHQEGTKHMPARPLFIVTRRVEERVSEIVAESLPIGRKGRR